MMFKSLVAIAALAVGVQAQVPTCETFCADWTGDANNDGYLVQSEAGCLTSCAFYPTGNETDTSGNTLGCRQYHYTVASGTPPAPVHFTHANLFGGQGVCGTGCDHYCEVMGTQCTGDNSPYADTTECMLACSFFPVNGLEGGTDGSLTNPTSVNPLATGGNSLECRTYHGQVGGTIDVHCGHAAGASVDDTCGTACEHFCDAVTATCTGDNAQFSDRAECIATCAYFGADASLPLATSGNSVGCRTYHTYVAAESTDMAASHCPHVGFHPHDAMCGDGCDIYCDTVMANCDGDNEVYATTAECQAACADFSLDNGLPQDNTGSDTLECRIYHASVAGTDAAAATTHCPHTQADSDTCITTTASSGAVSVQIAKASVALAATVMLLF